MEKKTITKTIYLYIFKNIFAKKIYELYMGNEAFTHTYIYIYMFEGGRFSKIQILKVLLIEKKKM